MTDDGPFDQDAEPSRESGAVAAPGPVTPRVSHRARHRMRPRRPALAPASHGSSGTGAVEGAPVPRRQLVRGFLDPHRFVLGPIEKVQLHEMPSMHAVLQRLPRWLLAAALLGFGLHFALTGWTVAWALVIATIAYLVVVVPARLARWKTTHYLVTNKRVMAVTGVWRRHVSSVPLDRITDVSYQQTLLEELIGIGSVHVLSANKDSTVSDLRHLANPAAFYSFLLKLVYESKLLVPPADPIGTAVPPARPLAPWEQTRRQEPVRNTLEF